MVDVVQRTFDKPASATAVVAAGAANVSEITITARNVNGAIVPGAHFDVYLSDSAAGVGYSASTTSGAVTVKTAGTLGTVIGTHTTKLGLRVQANASGVFTLSITDTNKVAFKVCVVIDGLPFVVATLVTASYG